MIDRNGVSDEKGNVLEDKLKEKMNDVLKAFPDFKGNPQQKSGFHPIGSPGNSSQNIVDEQLDAIFGIRKK